MAFSMGLGTGVFMVIHVDSFVAHVVDITLSSLSASSSSCSFPQVIVSVSIIILVCYHQVEEASATLVACSTQCGSSIYLRDLLEDMLSSNVMRHVMFCYPLGLCLCWLRIRISVTSTLLLLSVVK